MWDIDETTLLTQPLKIDLQHEAVLVASGDLRLSANQTCWPAQELMEQKLAAACKEKGYL